MEQLKNYNFEIDTNVVKREILNITRNKAQFNNINTLSQLFNYIDLTSLNESDTVTKISNLTKKVNLFNKTFQNIPNVASICVYPSLVATVKQNLTTQDVGITSVGAGFPASQTFLEIKILECKLSVLEGATEIDTVIPLGKFFENNYEYINHEIRAIKESIGKTPLKIIIESGCLRSYGEIKRASLLSMLSGADFIKTSTGKIVPAAEPEAFYIMCQAIKEYYNSTGRMVGIKAAGGITTTDQALLYYAIVSEVLGRQWLNNNFFRLGASRLANNLLSEISFLTSGNLQPINYF